jgi:hypothetical protein
VCGMQRAMRDRVRDFSRQLQRINEQKIASQPRPTTNQPKELSKREKVGTRPWIMYICMC